MSENNYVRIFDTTLRDGEQSPGATLTSSEKIDVARTLSRLGVDVIEAGFPAASPDDLAAVKAIAETVGCDNELCPGDTPPIICGLARAHEKDINAAWEAVAPAMTPRIHTFIATSDIHLKHKLRMERSQVVERVDKMVRYAKALCTDIEFSPEDAGRSDPEFLYEVLEVAIAAGATTLNIPDTVGYTTPAEFGGLIAGIIEHTPGAKDVIISTHCHNDLGLAVANSLAGVQAGARQVEVAVNGIGERAGNAALEEIVMALWVRRDAYGYETGVDTTQLVRTSKMVSSHTGMSVQPNKAIVGANAFAHESGIHQDGMLKHQETYEIMRPETVGAGQTQLVMGKHSGRHAVKTRLAELGYRVDGDELDKAFARFKAIADKKKVITDADLEAIVTDEMKQPDEIYTLDGLQVACGTMGMPTATVKLRGPDDKVMVQAAVGTGPVDAVYKAIDQLVALPVKLNEFFVHAVTEGIDALGEVTVKVESEELAATQSNPQHPVRGHRQHLGHGADTDIIVAAAQAYLAAINKFLTLRGVMATAAEPKGSNITISPNSSEVH
ncbi:MAG: 2-isopropylmalate synthase [Myxococcota bacterium]